MNMRKVNGSRYLSDKIMALYLHGAARSKVWACDRSLAGIAGLNPAAGIDVRLLGVLCVVKSLRRTDHSSRGVLPSVVFLSVSVKSR